MSDLKAAREWVQRARELLNTGKLAENKQQVEKLGKEFELLMQNSEVQKALSPELGMAMGQLAESLLTEPDLQSEVSPDEREARQSFKDFRGEFTRLQQSLAPVLSPQEAASFELALELGDGQAGVRQFEAALRVLQQSWHRLTTIRDEGRSGALALAPVVDESALEKQRRRETAEAELKKASEEVWKRLAPLDPLSRSEKLACTQFSVMFLMLTGKQRFDDALLVLKSWNEFIDAIVENDKKDPKRRERAREQRAKEQKAVEQFEKLGGREPAIESIVKAAEPHGKRLVEISRWLSRYNGGQPHDLESQTGPLVFEVERQVQRLRDLLTDDETGIKHFTRAFVDAEAALTALKLKRGEAEETLLKAQQQFEDRVGPKQKALDEFLALKNKGIDTQQLDVTKRDEQLTQFLESAKLLTDANGAKLQQPFSETTLEFYRKAVKDLEPKENPGGKKKPTISDWEKKQLAAARKLLAALEKKVELEQALAQSKQRLQKLVDEREKGVVPLAKELESEKLAQQIWWAPPEGITYGMPLTEKHLNATLSADNGRIEYRFGGKPVELGKTLLPAGLQQELEAVVLDGDDATYQATPPKKVKIDVAKAKVTLACSTTLAYGWGTAFTTEKLQATVSTEPDVPGDHKDLLAALSCLADGQAVKDKQVLDAKAWTLKLKCPGNANFEASNEVEVALEVRPAQQEIVWDGAAPTTITFGTAMVAQQLNASVKITTDPPLNERWAELTKALQYVDDKDQPVIVGTVLPAGEVRRVTVKTPPRANFAEATPKSVVFKVEKAARTLSTGTAPTIGAVVQRNDMKKLATVYKLTAGKGVVEYFVGKVQLAVGAKVAPGKKLTLSVKLQADDNYLPTPEQTHEIEVLGFGDKFELAKQTKTTLLNKKVHTKHTSAVNTLQQQIETLGSQDSVSDEDKFAKINALLEEIEEIEANLLTWQGPVPTPAPKGDTKLLDLKSDLPDSASNELKFEQKRSKTVAEVLKLIKHGGMKLADVEKLVPSGTPNSYRTSVDYPVGFKYIWVTPGGVSMEVYGHRQTVANNVPETSDSKKGNLVRVLIDGKYLQPNGTLTTTSTESTSHMALY